MSNGSSSCPQVTLPFGVFAGTPTIDPLDPSIVPPADQPPGLEQFIIDNAGDVATPADGFDQVFLETVGIVDALDSALATLEGDLLAAFTEADAIDPAPVGDTAAGFDASLAPSSSAIDDLGTLLASAKPPSPGGVGGGGESAKCGRHGQSSIGKFNYSAFDVLLTLPIASVADGVCTFPQLAASDGGRTTTNTRVATGATLISGDSALWGLSVRTVKTPAGTTDQNVYFQMTPKTPGHYDAVVHVAYNRPQFVEAWAVSIDVIA